MNTLSEATLAASKRTEEWRVPDHGVGTQLEMIQVAGWGELLMNVLPVLQPAATVPAQLHDLYRALVNPLLATNGNISDAIGIGVVPYGSTLAKLAQVMVDYAYSRRFCNGTLEHFQDSQANSRLIVATDAHLQHIIWGTLRVCWGPGLDIFELFAWEREGHQSTRSQGNKTGSFGRMALHPIFDNFGSLKTPDEFALFNAARIELAKGLVRAGMTILKGQSLDHVYFIASEARHRWLAMCGVQSRCVEDAVVAETLTMANLRQRYPGYWQDNPRLFELTDWALAAI